MAGDPQAFAGLVRRHHPRVIALCVSWLGNRSLAEDAAQEVFIKVFKRLHTFRRDAQFSTWLYRVALHHCLDIRRKEKRRRAESWEALVEEKGEPLTTLFKKPLDAAQSLEERDLIERVLKTLPEDYKTILLLRETQGLSYEEIAQTLECTLDAVKARLRRARHALRERCRHLLCPEDVQMSEVRHEP